MSKISPYEKEIWEKYIMGEVLYVFKKVSIFIDVRYYFIITGWSNNSPVFNVQTKEYARRYYSPNYSTFTRASGSWELFISHSRGTVKIDGDFGNDSRFPSLQEWEKHSHSDLLKNFVEGIKKVKEKLSFLEGVYLKSKYLPEELVAHIFSFIRKCEIENPEKP
jgi:hypothetical protein